jgi:uracil-DNA glycosylase
MSDGRDLDRSRATRFLLQQSDLGATEVILRIPAGEALLRALREGASVRKAAKPSGHGGLSATEIPVPDASVPDARVIDAPAAGGGARHSGARDAGILPPGARVPPGGPDGAYPSLAGPGGEGAPGADHDEVRQAALACTRCRLAKGRTQVVFSDGNPNARLMVVGEAPGANEDRTGVPFVGAAGKLLDLLLASIDLSRGESVYICNVIKCRPPGNRNPQPDEIEACAPYLHRQIEFVKPEAILAVGTFAAQLLTGADRTLGELRGKVHEFRGIPLVVTYHPAALLRNSGWTRPTWDDLQLLLQLLDAERAPT